MLVIKRIKISDTDIYNVDDEVIIYNKKLLDKLLKKLDKVNINVYELKQTKKGIEIKYKVGKNECSALLKNLNKKIYDSDSKYYYINK